MDTRKLKVVKKEFQGYPDAGLAYVAWPDGNTAYGMMPVEAAEELVRRWNAHEKFADLANAVVAGNTEHEDLEKMARAAINEVPEEPSATKTYTVILLRPDYATSNYGQDTWCGEGKGATPKEAMEDAKRSLMEDDDDIKDTDDLFVIACIEGNHDDHSMEQ